MNRGSYTDPKNRFTQDHTDQQTGRQTKNYTNVYKHIQMLLHIFYLKEKDETNSHTYKKNQQRIHT